MNDLGFYWIFWIFWILSAFFMRKNTDRLIISAWLLGVIALSLSSFQIGRITVSWTAIFILFTVYLLIIKENKRTATYTFITSYILMLGFAGFQLMELYDPVWLIFNRKWVLAAFLVYLTILLQKNLRLQMAVLLSGALHGDLLYAVMVRKITKYEAGSLLTLNVIALSLTCILLCHCLKEAAVLFDHFLKQDRREKQKTS